MKKILLFLLLIPIISHAQNCISSTDPKTGKNVEVGSTFLKDTIKNSIGVISFAKFGDKEFGSFAKSFKVKTSNYSVSDLLLLIKFNNGGIKKFTGNKDTRILPLPEGIMVGFDFDMSQEDISYFKNNPITNFKICHQGDEANGYDTGIDDTGANNIIKSLACIVPLTGRAPTCISTIDKETGKQVKSGITNLKDTTNFGGTFSFTKYDSTVFLEFRRDFILKEVSKKPVDADKLVLQIKFANGDTRMFAAGQMSIILPSPDGQIINMRIDLTKTDITYFKQNLIMLITVIDPNDESKKYATPITADQGDEIMNSINCIQ
jgi:hypothetical protein